LNAGCGVLSAGVKVEWSKVLSKDRTGRSCGAQGKKMQGTKRVNCVALGAGRSEKVDYNEYDMLTIHAVSAIQSYFQND
jgi:hypothetical protein